MKKVILFILSICVGSIVLAQDKANDNFKNKDIKGVISIERSQLIKIKYGNLPSVVRKNLEESDYKTWSVVAVYSTKQKDKFLLDLNDGTSATAHWFDKFGVMLNQESADPSLGVSKVN